MANTYDSTVTVVRIGTSGTSSLTYNDGQSDIVVLGSDGADTITSTGSNVTIDSGNGNDSVLAGGSNFSELHGSKASILAGAGDDTIYMGLNNTVSGGDGKDVFVWNNGIGAAVITDFGDNNYDDVLLFNAEADITKSTSGTNVVIKANADSITLRGAAANPLHLRTYDGKESIISSKGYASITGSTNKSNFIDNSGDKATIITGSADDTINATGKNVYIDAGDGKDLITASGEMTTIKTLNLNDTITATGKSAYVTTSGGSNSITVSGADSTIKIGGNSTENIVSLSGANSKIEIASGDNLIYATAADVNISLSSGNDTVYAGGANDTIVAGAGDDLITSTGNKVSIDAGAGADTIISTGSYTTITADLATDDSTGDDIATLGASVNSYNIYQYAAGKDTIFALDESDSINFISDYQVNLTGNTASTIDGDDVILKFTTIDGSNNRVEDTGNNSITIKDAVGKAINVAYKDTNLAGFIFNADGTVLQTKYITTSDKLESGSDNGDYIIVNGDSNTIQAAGGNDTIKINHGKTDKGTVIFFDNNGTNVTDANDGDDTVYGFASTDTVYLANVDTLGASVNGSDLIILTGKGSVTLKDAKSKTVTVKRDDSTSTFTNGKGTIAAVDSEDNLIYSAAVGNIFFSSVEGSKFNNDNYDGAFYLNDTTLKSVAISGNNVIFGAGTASMTLEGAKDKKVDIVDASGNYLGKQIYGGTSITVVADDITEFDDIPTINTAFNFNVVTINASELDINDNSSIYLLGNDKNNVIIGPENDSATINGGAGNDTLTGGSNGNVFIYTAGKDVITNYSTDDSINISGDSFTNYSISGPDVVFKFSNTNNTLTVQNGKNNKITFVDDSGTTIGTATRVYRSTTEFVVTDDDVAAILNTVESGLAPTVTAADSKVTLIDANLEYKGTDALYLLGNAAANSVIASSVTADTLYGGADKKADTLIGNGDTVNNGAPKNTFIYNYGEGSDVIVNYVEGKDVIYLGTATTIASSTLNTKTGAVSFTVTDLKGKNASTLMVKDAQDKKITFANDDSVSGFISQVFGTNSIDVVDEDLAVFDTRVNTSLKTIDASSRTESIYIIGNNNANTIHGGKGDTTIQGGTGNDSLISGNGNTTFAFGAADGTGNKISGYKEGDVIKLLSGAALTSITTISGAANADNLAVTIGKTRVTLEDAKDKKITIEDSDGHKYSQEFASKEIKVVDDDAEEGATLNTTANALVVTVDASSRNDDIYIVGNKLSNLIIAGKGNETIATGVGKDTLKISAVDSNTVWITDYTAGTDYIELADGISIVDAVTVAANGTFSGNSSSVAADTVFLTLQQNSNTGYLAVQGAIKTSGGKKTLGKLTIIDDTEGITYSQAYGSTSMDIANADGATIDVNNNSSVVTINAKKRTTAVEIFGNDNVNSIFGGTKADTIHIGTNGGTVDGAGGNDIIYGSDKADSINGGAGADTIYAGSGNNILYGGAGNDVFVYDIKDANDAGKDVIKDFTTGTNTLYLADGTSLRAMDTNASNVTFTLGGSSDNDVKIVELEKAVGKKITVRDGITGLVTSQIYGTNTLTVVNADGDKIDASTAVNAEVQVINASKRSKAIEIIGNAQNNTIRGGSKIDTIAGGSGNDYLIGGASNDIFVYSAGNDTISDFTVTLNKDKSIKATDYIQLANGAPTYYHVEGNNVVLEFSGTNPGDNTLTIVKGKDKKISFLDANGESTTPTFTGGPSDGITYNDYTEKIFTKNEATTYSATDSRVKLIDATKNAQSISIVGNANDNTIKGTAAIDTLAGGKGNDILTGGKGNDIFVYSSGNDTITDYAAGDIVSVVGAELTSLTVDNSTKNMVFTLGTDGDKTLTLQKAAGKKITIVDKDGHSTSQIYNVNKITVGNNDGATIDASNGLNNNLITIDASSRKAEYSIYIKGNSQSNTIKSGAGNDIINAVGGTNNYLSGGNGNDTLTAASSGNNTLIGGAGNDSLIGGGGTDVFNPGAGDDTIVLNDSHEKATITYTSGYDEITNFKKTDILTLASGVKATASGSGTSYTITLTKSNKELGTIKVTGTEEFVKGSSATTKSGVTTTNYYVTIGGHNITYSTTTTTTTTSSMKNYEEQVEEELFADDVVATSSDLGSIINESANDVAIAVDYSSPLTANTLTLDNTITVANDKKNKK